MPERVGGAVVPAGWYTDPENPAVLRWWDGAEWGGHRHDPRPVPPPPETPEERSRRRKKGWLIFGACVLAAGGIVVAVAMTYSPPAGPREACDVIVEAVTEYERGTRDVDSVILSLDAQREAVRADYPALGDAIFGALVEIQDTRVVDPEATPLLDLFATCIAAAS